jgi:uncharacterized protein YjbK
MNVANHLGKELKHELTLNHCQTLMRDLGVAFDETQDEHFNYYFETPHRDLRKRGITLRLRTAIKQKKTTHTLTLKIPSIETHSFLEYHQTVSEAQKKALVDEHRLPEGEIKDLTAIHGGVIEKIKVIHTLRAYAHSDDMALFFDSITHKGESFCEIGIKVDSLPGVVTQTLVDRFFAYLNHYDLTYTPAPRWSERFQ